MPKIHTTNGEDASASHRAVKYIQEERLKNNQDQLDKQLFEKLKQDYLSFLDNHENKKIR